MSNQHTLFSMKNLSPALLTLFVLTACSPGGDKMGAAASAESSGMESSSGSLESNGYVGQWTGPEGTALTITPAGEQFDVTIRNLDGPRDFTGALKADGIHVMRDGKLLVIHKGNGDDTGMKWLAGKQDCLVVDANEGYCRD